MGRTTLKVIGQSDERLRQHDSGLERVKRKSELSVTHAVRMESRRAETPAYYTIEGLADDDVIELWFQDDIRRWVTVAEFKEEFGLRLTRGGDPDELIIPPELPVGGPVRGATAWVLKGLRIIGFDPIADLAGEMAKKYDEYLMPEPGLYRYSGGLYQREGIINADDLSAKKPVLVFIHGTFSSTKGSFSKLPEEVWLELRHEYGENILGFDHRTLSLSPIQNALALAKNLPTGARLHLVTHSRGGLIGELLCRSGVEKAEPFDSRDFGLFESKAIPDEIRAALGALSQELKQKELKIERFVRVACPAGGTTLASGRLDRWLEVILNVVGKITGADAFQPYGIITDLLLDLKKQSANPEEIPGLAALMPTAPLVKLLNRPDMATDAALSVIAGDVEKTDIAGRIALFFADLFYFEDHDLVVHTRSMFGGLPRREGGRYFFDKGNDVNHFHYFSNRRTATRLRAALGDDRTELEEYRKKLKELGFRPISEARRAKTAPDAEITKRSYQKRSGIPQPVVFVLPGIMGSHLARHGDRIWLDILNLARGRLLDLQISNEGIEAQAPVHLGYGNLIDYLSVTHEVIPFPYDWRHSILDSAKRFGEIVAEKLAATDQPVRIVAHSMGGLVARALFGLQPELWEAFSKRDGARFILMGTPNRGSFVIPRLLLARERTLHLLALVDLVNDPADMLEIIARFPGVLELLPANSADWDFFAAETWNRLATADGNDWVKPSQADLNKAKALQAVLAGSPVDPNVIVYIAGYSPQTPVNLVIESDGGAAGATSVSFYGTDEGDGRVTWQSGELPDIKPWYMNVRHGDMANHAPAFPAVYELLSTGTTKRLSTIAPRISRAAARYYRLIEEEPEIFPDQIDLERAVLDADAAPDGVVAPSETAPINVSVAHGNLAFCKSPIAVGHYDGDTLVHAEKYLDHRLNGRLSVRHRLGRYPGLEGTSEVVLNLGEKPGGAIVVGLGRAGELTVQKLTDTFATALVDYAIQSVEYATTQRVEDEQPPGDGNLRFSSLLVGTGEMGLSVADSTGAILTGITRANQALTQVEPPYRVRISEVQFIELYKDRAVQAAQALQRFDDQENFQIEDQLTSLPGGLKRIAYREPRGWWSRLYVRGGPDHSIIFSVSAERARTEESLLTVQKRNIDQLIAQAVNRNWWDQRLAAAMFEMLIPNRLKRFSSDLSDIILVVDQESARYPWELIYDRRARYEHPLVVQMGVIRQLATPTFREQVIDVQNRKALVIGDPKDAPWGFLPLPGAEQEARLVAEKMKQSGFDPVAEIREDPVAIMTSLFADDYQIMHLAGHGVYRYQRGDLEEDDPEDQRITGMVLGNGVFLTPVEFEQLSQVPGLVFINCCFLGKFGEEDENRGQEIHYPRHEFAASLAQKLIEMGVKAVVAAGWAVDDAAALTFAEEFYDHMLRGSTFGEAVHEARKVTFSDHGDRTNTWGAYQCYGDPFYSIVSTGQADQPDPDCPYVDLEEAVFEIHNLYENARTASARSIPSLHSELEGIRGTIEKNRPKWLKDPRLNEALGQAFGEVGQFEQAVNFYEKALEHKKALAHIKAAEQAANLRARWAVPLSEKGEGQQAAKKIENSINNLDKLIKTFGSTTERLALKGSAYKRSAHISVGTKRAEALKNMEDCYIQAWELDKENPYPLTNAVVAHAARYWLGAVERRRPTTKDRIAHALSMAEEQKKLRQEDFWAAIGVTDAQLANHLVDGDLNPHVEKLKHDYETAWKRFGSPRELQSVIEHLEFLMAIFKSADQADGLGFESSRRALTRAGLYEALVSLSSALISLVET